VCKYSKSPTYAVNWSLSFPQKLKNLVTVLIYDAFLHMCSFQRIIKAKQVLIMKRKL
jgi:hypothetical protein